MGCGSSCGALDGVEAPLKAPPKPADPRVLKAESLYQAGTAEGAADALAELDSIIEDWPDCARGEAEEPGEGRPCKEIKVWRRAMQHLTQSGTHEWCGLRSERHLKHEGLFESLTTDYCN